MAINFLNTVDLNRNQLNQAVIQNLSVDPASNVSSIGQIIFNTAQQTLKIFNTVGGVNAWRSIAGDITGITAGTYINIDNADGPIPTINHNATSRTDTTSAASPAYGASFTAVDSVTTNATGHITAVNIKTVTLPVSDDTTYAISTKANSPNAADIDLTDSDGIVDTVTISGTAGEIEVTESGDTIFVGLPDDVTITSDLVVGDNLTLTSGNLSVTGTGSFTGEVTVPTATTGTSAPNLGQVQELIAGVGVFQGSYNAATNTPQLEGATNIALDAGDYFVVSVTGSFLGETLEPGNLIFANNAIAANSDPAIANYTLVKADDNVAGAGATDGATQKGVSGFDSESFTVSSNGWVKLKPQANPYGFKAVLNSSLAYVTRAEAGGLTTFTIDVADASIFGVGALAANVKIEISDTAAPYQTVYADIARSGAGTISAAFTGSIANSVYTALLSYV